MALGHCNALILLGFMTHGGFAAHTHVKGGTTSAEHECELLLVVTANGER